MAKRLTASDKWEDPWFRRLPPDLKLFWVYLLDKCTHAGIFIPDMELAEFYIGKKLDANLIRKVLKGRLVECEDGKWFIPKYIHFQYKKLNPANVAHKGVIETLQHYGLVDDNLQVIEAPLKLLQSSFKAPKDKDKIKAKASDKEKV